MSNVIDEPNSVPYSLKSYVVYVASLLLYTLVALISGHLIMCYSPHLLKLSCDLMDGDGAPAVHVKTGFR